MEHISKRFPGVVALDDVSFEILPGEVHGLLGENGAGKSTLLKILSGAYQPDAGTITLAGEPITLPTPLDAQRQGIVTIYQEFNLIPTMTVAENMFLGREPGSGPFVSWRRMREATAEALGRLGLDLDPMMPVSDLSVGEQQMVEIARALSMESRIIIMDEPTSALTEHEVDRLFRIIAELKSQGLSIVYVTHRLQEVMQICDRVTVLRDGARVGGGKVGELGIDDFIRMMVGRSSSQLFTRLGDHRAPGPVVLKIEGLWRERDPANPHATLLRDISLEVRAGEILGLAGLMGAGRTEVARCIFGADPHRRGTITIEGVPVGIRSPIDAIRHGIGLVPEDRKQQALFLDLAVRHNLAISSLKNLSWGRWFVNDARRTRAGRALSQGPRHPHGIRRHQHRRPVRRQPTKGRAGALAGPAPQGADRRRADARHRHRGESRGPPAARCNGAVGNCGDRDLVRTARGAGDQRPHRDHARRADHRRHAAQSGNGGRVDAFDGYRPIGGFAGWQ